MSLESEQMKPMPVTFQMAEWTVDAQSHRITHDDIERKLESKVMAVLVYLVEHSDRLVTRDELEREIWGGTIVGYDALTSSVAKLRKSLDDNSRKPRFIETVSKKGYRLIADINLAEAATTESLGTLHSPGAQAEDSHAKRRLPYLYGLLLAVLIVTSALLFWPNASPYGNKTQLSAIDIPSIVVLPFENIGLDKKQKFLSDGITRDVTTSLSKLSGVFIIATSSAYSYLDRNIDAKQIAKELGVRYIVDGSVQGNSSRLRISVQLIDALSGFHLWAENYDRERGDLFVVQDDITTKVASALSVQLTEREKERIASRYTNNIEAYDEFTRGQSYYTLHTKEDNQVARDYYAAAIQLDQSFARAYAAQALTYADEYRFRWSDDPDQSLQKARQMVLTAINIDDQLPQAFWVSSLIHMHLQQYEMGISLAKRAIELDPNYADSYAALAMSSIYNGDAKIALEYIRRAIRLNPHYPSHYASAMGQAYYYLGQYQDALPVLRDAVQRNLNLQTSYMYLIATLVKLQQQEEAEWFSAQLRNLAPDFNAAQVVKTFPIKDKQRAVELVNQLRAAGL